MRDSRERDTDMPVKMNILILLALLGVVAFLPPHRGACAAGTIAPQTCDTQVWQTMAQRAQLETEREIMQNQNLIFKADSVLNYTCFDKFAAHAAKNVGVLFTHTTYFNYAEVIPWGAPYGMDYAMDNVVINSMQPYIQGNFQHAFLGGRGTELGLMAGSTQSVGSRGRDYGCGVMNEVWAKAKCLNFLHTEQFKQTDGFYPFANLAASGSGQAVQGYETVQDTRKYPTACNGTPVTGSTWKDAYAKSKNGPFGTHDELYQFGTPLRKAFTDVRNLIKPGNCSTAIKTGVSVILSPGSTNKYDDGVCTNPGCTYKKSGQCE